MTELAVKTTKKESTRTQKKNKEDAFLAVLAYRNTTSQGMPLSTAQRMLDK